MRSDGIFPRTKKQSTGLFFARCGAPSCSNPRPSGDKKDPQPKLEVLLVRVVIQHFLKTIVVQFVFEVVG